MSIGRARKNIQDVYLDPAPSPKTVKKWFCRFRNCDFNLKDEIHYGPLSDIDNDEIRNLINNIVITQ